MGESGTEMNDFFNAILLGIIEGLTEFLPVSSTAHLLVAENLLGLRKEDWEAFTVVIQFGAVLSVVVVYWHKFWSVLIGLPTDPKARHFALSVIVAFLPSAVIGLLLIKFINAFLLDPMRALPVIGIAWLAGGILILLFERIAPRPRYHEADNLPLSKAFQIGLCQCAALLPGISRSGATILGGELLGVERKTAALFTFYLAVPTMLGASVVELYQQRAALSASNLTTIAVGFVVSFIVAYFVVKTFIDFIGRYGLKPFGWYRVAIGIILLAALLAS
jgi:undecaprenyl-diphosphatase